MRPTQPSARSRRVLLATLAIPLLALLVVVVIGFTAQSSRANGGSPPPPPMKMPPLGNTSATPAYTGPWGIPAIHPEAALAHSKGPHFTLADVEQYLAANPIPAQEMVKGAPAPTVASFTCETPKQLAAQYPGIGGYPVALVCVVVLSGSFTGSYSGPYLGGDVPPPAPFTKGVMGFDAYTGNLIMTNMA